MESGSALVPWAFISTTTQQKTVLKFARRYANSSQIGEPLTEFLQNIKPDTIERHTFRYFVQGPPPITMKPTWAPIIEGLKLANLNMSGGIFNNFCCSTVEGAIDPFMQKSPIELMLEKHKKKDPVDTMFGFNSNVRASVSFTFIQSVENYLKPNQTITFPGSNLLHSVVHSKSNFAVAG